MAARQHDDQAVPESDRDPAEGFGGQVTPVTPDSSASSRWDQDSEDEDALVVQDEETLVVGDARSSEDVAGL